MHDIVRDRFFDFSVAFEGYIPYMYLDVKGLVTVGVGCLIDPFELAAGLPFHHRADLRPATRGEVQAAWRAVKRHPTLASRGARAAKAVCTLDLPERAIRDLVTRRLLAAERTLRADHFPLWNTWPANAQLAVLSMAWAMGASFPAKWPKFRAACLAEDWSTAAAECRMREAGNPGLRPRNDANQQLLLAASLGA